MFKCCKSCPGRCSGCHSTCGRYLLAKRAHDLREAKIRAAREADTFIRGRALKAIQRARLRGAR